MKPITLPSQHYAAAWPTDVLYPVAEVNELGQRYARLPEGEEKKEALLGLCRCFHSYVMKYLTMICRGHVPMYAERINRDVKPFIQYFMPKGTPLNHATAQKAVCHLHLAFKGMNVEEIYGVLLEQLVKAIHKFDPNYTDKVKSVVEKIDNELPQQRQFSIAELNRYLEFDSNRYVRLLCRRGFLALVFGRDRRITGFTRAAWPVPAEFFQKGAIGLTYYLQTWFRYYLQTWIDGRMSARKED